MRKFKDILYDKNDILVAVVILLVAAAIIFFRINAIMDYSLSPSGTGVINIVQISENQ